MRPAPAPLAALALSLALAACATPQQQCINRETRDLRVVNSLIAQLETNIARGYTLVPSVTYMPQWVFCGPPHGKYGPGMCLDTIPTTVARPASFDIAEAQRQLAQLKQKRRELEQRASSAVAQCRAAYPAQG